jgi:hypothetical protein
MMTLELLKSEIAKSEAEEEKTYKRLTRELFRALQEPLKALFDQTAEATQQFAEITPNVLKEAPQIIKTLRYCLAPVISQMRLGQLVGLSTTDTFEERGTIPTADQAKQLARWFNDYLDRDRFPWLDQPTMKGAERTLAESYAKLWTVSLQSNQNAATEYRTKRKEQQESAIATALDGMGLKDQDQQPKSPQTEKNKRNPKPQKLGGINEIDDVRPAHFVRNKKVLAGSQKKQTTDLAVRPSTEPKLVCIEAKAVGIKLDSTKRLKELNDKYTDWSNCALDIVTVGVVAGMFNTDDLVATIKLRGIPIFFEHGLDRLVDYLKTDSYYGKKWNPNTLFPDV